MNRYGVLFTSGTFAARPASPSVGAQYYANDDVNGGRAYYECLVAGEWRAVTAPQVVIPLDNVAGWSTSAGAGGPTATINTVAQRIELVVPNGTAFGERYANAYRTTPEPGSILDAGAYEVVARLWKLEGAGTADDYAELLLLNGGTYVGVRIYDDDTAAYRSDIGSGVPVSVPGISTGSVGFAKIVVVGNTASLYAGIGAGGDVEPTTWTCLGMITRPASAPYVTLRLGCERASDGVELLVDWRFIRAWATVTR